MEWPDRGRMRTGQRRRVFARALLAAVATASLTENRVRIKSAARSELQQAPKIRPIDGPTDGPTDGPIDGPTDGPDQAMARLMRAESNQVSGWRAGWREEAKKILYNPHETWKCGGDEEDRKPPGKVRHHWIAACRAGGVTAKVTAGQRLLQSLGRASPAVTVGTSVRPGQLLTLD